jgi:hypothetical protein
VGGPLHAHVLLPLLENLAAVEDASVRDQVIATRMMKPKERRDPALNTCYVTIVSKLFVSSSQHLTRTTLAGALPTFTE